MPLAPESTFVDTSAIYALIDADDAHHGRAAEWFGALATRRDRSLVTHNYTVVECAALVQTRLGRDGLRALSDLLDLVAIEHVDLQLHGMAWRSFLATGRREDSFVDSVSFAYMRGQRIDEAFCFDRHFTEQGFRLVP